LPPLLRELRDAPRTLAYRAGLARGVNQLVGVGVLHDGDDESDFARTSLLDLFI
jgi:hypothetical protein